jgi:putative hydrolase
MEPAVAALERTAYLLERQNASSHKVEAFRRAAAVLAALGPAELRQRADAGTLTELPGIGARTAEVASAAAKGQVSDYLAALEEVPTPEVGGGAELLAALRGDLHTHSDWSDGGSPIEVMTRAAAELGHEYIALTDHSPRLTVARGLSPQRLRDQLDVVARVNAELAPFRILTGIEVDILDDGGLDQEPELLDQLDVVVASVHSKLRMAGPEMTRRMVAAIASGRMDVLGHCTGRMVVGKGRPPSEFDAELVFEACRRFDVAVEINSRPERLDPPRPLLRLAVETGCRFAIDTDAHAPGQLEWQPNGCARAAECDVPAERVVNTWSARELLDWVATRRRNAGGSRAALGGVAQ